MRFAKHCSVCGTPLELLEAQETLACYLCGEQHKSSIWCPEGHFVCDSCYHKPIMNFIADIVNKSRSKSPFDLAIMMMAYPSLPEQSCEHAWILTASVLTAVKNEGTICLTNDAIFDALEVVREQTAAKIVNMTGVCGLALAVGAIFHAAFKAYYGQKEQDGITMKVVAQVIENLAESSTRCRCCKSLVWTTMDLIAALLNARFGIELEGSADEVVCHQVGTNNYCNPATCQFSLLLHG